MMERRCDKWKKPTDSRDGHWIELSSIPVLDLIELCAFAPFGGNFLANTEAREWQLRDR